MILLASGNSGSSDRSKNARGPRHHSTTGRSGAISGTSNRATSSVCSESAVISIPSEQICCCPPNGIQHSANTRPLNSPPSLRRQHDRAAGMLVHQHADRLPGQLGIRGVVGSATTIRSSRRRAARRPRALIARQLRPQFAQIAQNFFGIDGRGHRVQLFLH